MEIEGSADLFVHLNVWPLVLEFIPTIMRPRLSEVSKSWRDLVAGSWRAFEVALTQQQAATTDEFNRRIGDMIKYLIFNNGRLVDINIKLHFRNNSRGHLNNWVSRLLGIRTLKRLNFEVLPRGTSTVSIQSDIACTGLELLNLSTIKIESSDLDKLLLRLPKLVELYLDEENRITSAKQLRKLTKLQRLLANTKAYGDIVATCPSLKYLIRAGSKPWISSSVGKALILSSEAFELETLADIEHTKRILPLLTGYCAACDDTMIPMLTYLSMDPVRYQELIDFLVKEGKFDFNAGPPSFLYRPTFSKDFPKVDATYPLEIALQTNNIEFAKKLIALGAKAEHPDPSSSFITIAKSGEALKLLVDHGADLYKLLNFQEKKATVYKEKFPAFMVPILRGKDYRKYIDSIKSRVNINIVVNGRSFLEWAIVKGCWDTYISLLDAGAKWTSGALYSLLAYAPDRFGRVVTKNNFDLEFITPKMATLAVQQGYAHLLRERIRMRSLHHSIGSARRYNYETYIPEENNTRWMVPKILEKQEDGDYDYDDGWSSEEPLEGWDEEKEEDIEEGNAMLIDEVPEGGEDISLDAPRNFKKVKALVEDEGPEEEHWNEQEAAEIEAPGTVNPFDYKVKAKPLNTFIEALDVLHGDLNLTTKDGESAILLLCQSDMKPERKVGRLKALLAKRADVRVPDKNGWTPLHAACYKQDISVFEVLLQAGADINARDKFGNSPLLVGFQSEYPLFTQWGDDVSFEELTRFYWKALQLIDKLGIKVDLNATHVFLKKQFIHYIATLGTPKFLRYIADRVDINSQDANGLTPLHHAVLMNNSLSVRQLLRLGADPNIPTHSLKMTPAMLFMHILTKGKFSKDEPYADEERFSNPLMRIQWFESPYAMWLTTNETLLEAVYRVRHVEKYDVNNSADLLDNFSRRQSEPVLYLAALKDAPWLEYAQPAPKYNYAHRLRLRNVENLLHLLLQYSDLTKIDSHGNTYLHLAVKYHARPGCLWNIETLLTQFPQLNTQWNIKNDCNDTPFSLMCRACEHFQGFVPVIKSVLKQHEIDVTGTDSHGHSPAHYLISHVTSEDDLAELELLQGWSSVTMCQPATTIVDLLLQDKYLTKDKLVELLAANSSVLMARDSLGRTLLMRILQGLFEQNSNYWPYVDVVLQHKEHLNVQDNNGNTALHMACKYFHLGLVESILGKINNTRYSERFFVTAFKLLEAGSDPSIKNKRGEIAQDYVPHLHEYYQELYCNWIKQLDYKDDMTITYEGRKANQQAGPSRSNYDEWDFIQPDDDTHGAVLEENDDLE